MTDLPSEIAARAIADTSRYDAPTEERELDAHAAINAMETEGLAVVRIDDVFKVARETALLRSALGRALVHIASVRGMLSPGMRAGTAEACETLDRAHNEAQWTLDSIRVPS